MRHTKLKWSIVGLVGTVLMLRILIGVIPLIPKEYLETREEQATRVEGNLLRAVKKYYMEHGDWPPTLPDAKQYLEHISFIDPWGTEYKYAIVPMTEVEGIASETPYIWSEHIVYGEIQVYGNKPPVPVQPQKGCGKGAN